MFLGEVIFPTVDVRDTLDYLTAKRNPAAVVDHHHSPVSVGPVRDIPADEPLHVAKVSEVLPVGVVAVVVEMGRRDFGALLAEAMVRFKRQRPIRP